MQGLGNKTLLESKVGKKMFTLQHELYKAAKKILKPAFGQASLNELSIAILERRRRLTRRNTGEK